MSFLSDKVVLVTGGAGTVGQELIRQILAQRPADLRVIDNNESETFFLEEVYGSPYRGYATGNNVTAGSFHAYIGDVRDRDRMFKIMDDVQVVFHAAALKHVILCERSPFDAVQSNILGVQNIIDAALANNVERVIFTSSDKAVNPTSVMGTSKLMGERLIAAASSLKGKRRTVFSSTRFGNVIGSRGSVFQIFQRQIRDGGPLTLTHPDMTRFVMTVAQSVRLVLDAAELARGGEVMVTKMPVMRIEDLAHAMVELLAPQYGYDPDDISFQTIGAKAGEKLYEELMSEEETRRAIELEQMFAVLPAFRSVYQTIDYTYPGTVTEQVDTPYTSSVQQAMDTDQIKRFLVEHDLLEDDRDEGGK